MKKCSQCEKPAVIYRKYEGRHLCSAHFMRSFEKKVKATISKYEMVDKNDVICVALSGGKDSCATLYILKKIFGKRPDIKIFALTIDEGIKGYRDESIEMAKKLCKRLGVEHHIVSFKDEFKMTLDEKIKESMGGSHTRPDTAHLPMKVERNTRERESSMLANMFLKKREPSPVGRRSEWKSGPCTYCGVARRYMLNKCARKFGATKVATGHNLDDEVQAIFMDYINGNLSRASRMGKTQNPWNGLENGISDNVVSAVKEKLFIPRIKPFREIPEKEVALYAILKDMDAQFAECPHVTGIRFLTRDFINDLEANHSGSKYSIVETFNKILPCIQMTIEKKIESGEGKLARCKICGEPSSQEICKTCELWRNGG
ncbi:MAG: TIGR00269 family protein [Candidatus Micrarchaeota archaeon]|nr:TIGR00269 family protein [Candidatus Micrarchaeota archaeon]